MSKIELNGVSVQMRSEMQQPKQIHSIQMAEKNMLRLTINTWEKDSHGLYDYEVAKNIKEEYAIASSCKIFRNWHAARTEIYSLDRVKRGTIPDESFTFFTSILHQGNGGSNDTYTLAVPEKLTQPLVRKESREGGVEQINFLNTNAYIVIKFYRMFKNGYPLSLGSVIKLGRVEYRIVEIGGRTRAEKRQDGAQILGQFNGVHRAQGVIEGTCKFCLCDENTEDNFLISPCNCAGSCAVVHNHCLKMWIDSKVKKEVNGLVMTYNFTKFECELCKEPFPRLVVRDDYELEMITIDKPKKPYIILEGINERKESKEERCLHVISLNDNQTIKIGRGHQCEIRLQDISVSRTHSEIKFLGNEFLLNDINSKFGTLVKIDKSLEIHNKMKIQVGRSLFQFTK